MVGREFRGGVAKKLPASHPGPPPAHDITARVQPLGNFLGRAGQAVLESVVGG